MGLPSSRGGRGVGGGRGLGGVGDAAANGMHTGNGGSAHGRSLPVGAAQLPAAKRQKAGEAEGGSRGMVHAPPGMVLMEELQQVCVFVWGWGWAWVRVWVWVWVWVLVWLWL